MTGRAKRRRGGLASAPRAASRARAAGAAGTPGCLEGRKPGRRPRLCAPAPPPPSPPGPEPPAGIGRDWAGRAGWPALGGLPGRLLSFRFSILGDCRVGGLRAPPDPRGWKLHVCREGGEGGAHPLRGPGAGAVGQVLVRAPPAHLPWAGPEAEAARPASPAHSSRATARPRRGRGWGQMGTRWDRRRGRPGPASHRVPPKGEWTPC